MRHVIFLIILSTYISHAHAEPLQPLAVSQNNPAMLRFFTPVALATPQEGRTSISFKQSYSSIFLADQLPNAKHYLADMELYLAELKLAHSINSTSSIYLQLPILRPNAGILDPFLHQYHQALSLPNGGREYRPENSYAYQYSQTSKHWDSQPRWDIGNIQAQWRYIWRKQENLQVSNAVAIKIPTAPSSRGWSNGGTDIALGMIAAWQGTTWASHAEVWYTHPLKRQDLGGDIRDYIRSNLSLGYNALYPFKATWIAQVQGGNSPYQTGIAALDQSPWLISAGIQVKQASGNTWRMSFVENITQSSTQDFGINIEIQMPIQQL